MARAASKAYFTAIGLFAFALCAHCSSPPEATTNPGGHVDAAQLDAGVDSAAQAQVDPCSGPDTIKAVSVRAYVDAMVHGPTFTPYSAEQVATATTAAHALINDDIAGAKTAAAMLGYRVVPLLAGTECLWSLEPAATSLPGHGTLITRTTYARDLIIEAPHIPFDQDTDIEAAIVFDTAGARAALFAGAQRCALLTTSGCGLNAACGPMSPVQSDAGHSVDSAFHGFHMGIGVGTSSVVIQFHSNLHPADNGDAMVTNGTRAPFVGTVAERVYNAVKAKTMADVRSCNVGTVVTTALCGTDNTQGHATNGATDACNGIPLVANDHFIHIEQNGKLLPAGDTWKNQIAAAIVAAIPARK